MFSFLIKKGAVPFSESETFFTRLLLEAFKVHCTREGAFLHQVDIESLHFFWSKWMAQHTEGFFGGIMGAWDPGTKKNIYIVPLSIAGGISSSFYGRNERAVLIGSYLLQSAIGSTLVHEINHSWQYKTVGPIIYMVNRLVTLFFQHCPFLKKFTLEGDVDRHISENKEVENFFDTMTRAWDSLSYYDRCQRQLARKVKNGCSKEDLACFEKNVLYSRLEWEIHPKHIKEVIRKMFEYMANLPLDTPFYAYDPCEEEMKGVITHG